MLLKEISIEITQCCPNYCIHCSSLSSLKTKETIPYSKVIELIDDAIQLGASKICLSGGEPFMHPDILKISNYISKRGVLCSIYTSGILCRKDHFYSIPMSILKLIPKDNTTLIINYEASDSKNYDFIMGTQCRGYLKMRNTIRKCVKLGIKVETHVVPMPANIHQLTAIVGQCNDLGVNMVSFLRLVPQGRAEYNKFSTCLTEDQTVELRKNLIVLKNNQTLKIRIGIPLGSCGKKINCHTGTSKLNVRYDGRVYPCEAFKNDLPMNFTCAEPDSIYEKPLKEIYYDSSYLHEIRDRLHIFQSIQTCENCMNQYYRKDLLK